MAATSRSVVLPAHSWARVAVPPPLLARPAHQQRRTPTSGQPPRADVAQTLQQGREGRQACVQQRSDQMATATGALWRGLRARHASIRQQSLHPLLPSGIPSAYPPVPAQQQQPRPLAAATRRCRPMALQPIRKPLLPFLHPRAARRAARQSWWSEAHRCRGGHMPLRAARLKISYPHRPSSSVRRPGEWPSAGQGIKLGFFDVSWLPSPGGRCQVYQV